MAIIKSQISGSTQRDESVITKTNSIANNIISNGSLFQMPKTVDFRNSVNLNNNLN